MPYANDEDNERVLKDAEDVACRTDVYVYAAMAIH